MADVSAMLEAAVQHHQIGCLEQADMMYRQVLQEQPENPVALHSLGALAYQKSQYDLALDLVGRAISSNPRIPQFHNTLGVILEAQGRPGEAVDAYSQAVSLKADYAEAHNNMAIALQSQGQYARAIEICKRAALIDPDYAEVYNTMGFAQQMQGKLHEAIESYRKATLLDPDFAEAYNHVGVVLSKQEQYAEAVANYKQALRINPGYAEVHNNLSIALKAMGQLNEAVESCRRALELEPDFAQAYFNLANAMRDQGGCDEAIANYGHALKIDPDYAEVYNNLGILLNDLDRSDEAAENYQRAIRLKPDYAEAYNNLGIVFKNRGRLTDAIVNYERAIQLEPQFFEAYYNLANTLKEQGHCDQAIENYGRAIEIKPGYAQAHWNRSHAFLLKGEFTKGWQGYEWRRDPELEIFTYPHRHRQARWDGSDFVGKRLLVHCEQGLGDSLQFMRYLPMVKALGGTVIFEAWKPLHGILQDSEDIDELLELSFERKTDVDFDLHISLMDLPAVFGTTLEAIPAEVPYVCPEPQKVEHWRGRLDDSSFNVGIVWAGSPQHGNDHNRSCPLELFAPLAAIERVQLYGLQKGEAAGQAEGLSQVIAIENLSKDLHDFADTAGVLENLDLVISVDTAPAHLAGAMGKPTWLLLPFAPDWRWMLERTDSPWYPTMRLFRQEKWGDWNSVFEDMVEELRKLAQNRSRE
ncbi:MAG: tetratricopeptide repeat protein [Planctomycetota bacterium]|nr:tetratricopeptide repeat protein [Planctomycetota bacterium]